jgi:hypothetical protein
MDLRILAFIDWDRGVWAFQYRNDLGVMVSELTEFSANTPSIVVCDELQKSKPTSVVFATSA